MPGHSRPKGRRASHTYVPSIHVLRLAQCQRLGWPGHRRYGRTPFFRTAMPDDDGTFEARRLRIVLSPPRRLHDLVRILHRFAAFDLVHVLHAFDPLAPGRVLPVEEARVVEADEELAVAGIRILGR